jgi:hypothetical protein
MRSHSLINHIVSLAIAATMSTSWRVVAQAVPPTGEPIALSSWKDLGFDEAPEGYPTDQIPLFEGLNKSRGGWSFTGSISEADTVTPVEGRMQSLGSFKDGMVPMWKLALGWPAEQPEQVVSYTITASPEADGFKLMLARLGPTRPEAGAKPQRAIFQGKWNLESRTIAWTTVTKSELLPGLPAGTGELQDAPESFEMVVANNGEITIRYPEEVSKQQRIAGKATARVGKPYVEEPASTKRRFDTAAEVSDPRVRQCLPPGARDITVRLERGGHFARYRVSEAEFHKFLNSLWETEKDNSAHQRDEMHGEGEAANQERLAQRFKPLGWKPLKGAVIYFSPSKPSGAMTTYYFEREAGIVYHDTGYW